MSPSAGVFHSPGDRPTPSWEASMYCRITAASREIGHSWLGYTRVATRPQRCHARPASSDRAASLCKRWLAHRIRQQAYRPREFGGLASRFIPQNPQKWLTFQSASTVEKTSWVGIASRLVGSSIEDPRGKQQPLRYLRGPLADVSTSANALSMHDLQPIHLCKEIGGLVLYPPPSRPQSTNSMPSLLIP